MTSGESSCAPTTGVQRCTLPARSLFWRIEYKYSINKTSKTTVGFNEKVTEKEKWFGKREMLCSAEKWKRN